MFPRSTKPKGAVGQPRLVGFGDASSIALCAVVYVLWTDDKGRHHPRVLTGKCRVAPLLGTTIPRGELQALVVLHRLVLAVVEAFPYRFRSVSTYTDSLCSLGAIHKPSSSLKPFFGNRVLEILRIREQLLDLTDELAPISHIPGESNPADLGTRGLVSVGDLGPGSYWQSGPSFLEEDYAGWPRTSIVGDPSENLPPEECVSLFGSVAVGGDKKGVLNTLVQAAGLDNSLGECAPNHGSPCPYEGEAGGVRQGVSTSIDGDDHGPTRGVPKRAIRQVGGGRGGRVGQDGSPRRPGRRSRPENFEAWVPRTVMAWFG